MNYLADAFPEFGVNNTVEELYTFNDLYPEPEGLISLGLKKFAGLSRQCMQPEERYHLGCMDGTRASCVCPHHKENR